MLGTTHAVTLFHNPDDLNLWKSTDQIIIAQNTKNPIFFFGGEAVVCCVQMVFY